MSNAKGKAKDPYQLRLNSYRVLLTRGRDGFVVLVPPEQLMTSKYRALREAGLIELGSERASEAGRPSRDVHDQLPWRKQQGLKS